MEERTQGDPFRGWGKGGYSPTFRSVNRGKRSLGDRPPQAATGRRIVADLADRADVLIENYRPGVVDRLGLGYAAVSARNPRIVYCSISGFGSSGPYRDRPGYDTVGQAMSGLLGMTTDFEAPRHDGHLVLRPHHGRGGRVRRSWPRSSAVASPARAGWCETSLLQATTSFLAENAARYFDEGESRPGPPGPSIAQAYAFVAGDGGPFVVHLSSPPKFWSGLTERRRPPGPARRSPIRRSGRPGSATTMSLSAILGEIFRTAPRAEWLAKLEANDVPAGPINRFDEVFADPGVQALGMVRTVRHPTAGEMRLLAGPVTISGHDEARDRRHRPSSASRPTRS